MITCILEQKNTHIHVNYDKVREITQGADENPGLFLGKAPHKNMPNLWPMGTLEDGLSPGMLWHP